MYRVLKHFEYFEPSTIEEAVRILSKYGNNSKPLAGGVDLIPKMRRHELSPECVVSLKKLPALDYLKADKGTGLRIGALTTLRAIELSSEVQKDYKILYDAVHQIASVQVKTMGTAVGNLCVATPASDVAAALLALGATLKITGTGPEKMVPVEDFFIGVGQTMLKPHELVTEISVPALSAGSGSAFLNLSRTKADIAKVIVAVTLTIVNNVCKEAKIALGSVAPTPVRSNKAEEALKGHKMEPKVIDRAAEIAAEGITPITDIRSTAEYRKETTRILVRRAIEKALATATA